LSCSRWISRAAVVWNQLSLELAIGDLDRSVKNCNAIPLIAPFELVRI
jgi:hypothetical protein